METVLDKIWEVGWLGAAHSLLLRMRQGEGALFCPRGSRVTKNDRNNNNNNNSNKNASRDIPSKAMEKTYSVRQDVANLASSYILMQDKGVHPVLAGEKPFICRPLWDSVLCHPNKENQISGASLLLNFPAGPYIGIGSLHHRCRPPRPQHQAS